MSDESDRIQEQRSANADGLVILQWFLLFCQSVIGLLACSQILRTSGRGLHAAYVDSIGISFAAFFFGAPVSIAAIIVAVIALLLQRKLSGVRFSRWFYGVSLLTILCPLLTEVVSTFLTLAYAYP